MQTNTTFWGDERMGDEGCLSASSLLLRWVSLFTTALRCLAESMTTNEQKIELPLKSTEGASPQAVIFLLLPASVHLSPVLCQDPLQKVDWGCAWKAPFAGRDGVCHSLEKQEALGVASLFCNLERRQEPLQPEGCGS